MWSFGCRHAAFGRLRGGGGRTCCVRLHRPPPPRPPPPRHPRAPPAPPAPPPARARRGAPTDPGAQGAVGRVAARRAKSALGRLWVLGNGVTLHCFGRIFRIPFTRPRWESFQTPRGMRRALRAGFDETEISRGRFFVVTARRSA